ncbi:MAG: hypothetical protein GEU93_14135 [Propionibacteriales bacterium]|nr:hypothetical protein [Propionibacteriales bacterium]
MRILAHGVGGGRDLPIPFEYAVVGASWALVISFAILAFAWRASRFRGDESGIELPERVTAFVDSVVTRTAVRALALAFAGYFAVALLFGPDLLTNPAFGVFYIYLWVGIVPASLLLGHFWRLVSPLRLVHLGLSRLMGLDPTAGLVCLPRWLGYWPAAAGLLSFVWLELVYPGSTYLSSIRVWLGLYALILLGGSVVYGSRWFARADPFEVLSSLVARLSPFGRRKSGRIVLRNPLENLDGLSPEAGLVAVISVLFGSTAFDSFGESPTWVQFVQSSSVDATLLDTLVLCGFVAVVGLTFSVATMAVGGLGHVERRRLPRRFAHSVVPIIVGYFAAHYLTLLFEVGQQTAALLSDPLGRGWNVFGTADMGVTYFLTLHPTALATTKVAGVVVGHLLAAVSAHDRAVRILPRGRELVGQLPLLLVMVFYTSGGLYLLLSA